MKLTLLDSAIITSKKFNHYRLVKLGSTDNLINEREWGRQSRRGV
jgi:hypothetical protein